MGEHGQVGAEEPSLGVGGLVRKCWATSVVLGLGQIMWLCKHQSPLYHDKVCWASRPTVRFPSQARECICCRMKKALQATSILYLVLEHLSACVVNMEQRLDCELAVELIASLTGLHAVLGLSCLWTDWGLQGLLCAGCVPLTPQGGTGEITCRAAAVLNPAVLHPHTS